MVSTAIMFLHWFLLLPLVTADAISPTENNKNEDTLDPSIYPNDGRSLKFSSLATAIFRRTGVLAPDINVAQNPPTKDHNHNGGWILPKYLRSMLSKEAKISHTRRKRNEVVIYCGRNQYPNPTSITRDMAEKAIDKFCKEEMTLDPTFELDESKFYAETPAGMAYSNVVMNNTLVRIQAFFPVGRDQGGCASLSNFQMRNDNCVRTLMMVIDECDTGTAKEKNGGYLVEKSEHGCVRWEIFAQIIN